MRCQDGILRKGNNQTVTQTYKHVSSNILEIFSIFIVLSTPDIQVPYVLIIKIFLLKKGINTRGKTLCICEK